MLIIKIIKRAPPNEIIKIKKSNDEKPILNVVELVVAISVVV